MTREEVIRIAKLAATKVVDYDLIGNPITDADVVMLGAYGPFIERFAQLVAAEYKRDAERLDFIEKEMNDKIHRVGDRWYWSRARHRTYYCEGGLREVIDAAMEMFI